VTKTPVLTSLMTGTLSRSDGAETQQVSDQQSEPLRHARYSYDSVAKFSAWVKVSPADRGELRLVFTLDGLSWKLSNIVVRLLCLTMRKRLPEVGVTPEFRVRSCENGAHRVCARGAGLSR